MCNPVGIDNDTLAKCWERKDKKSCRKGDHETSIPIWKNEFGGLLGWRCYCGQKVEIK